MTVLLHSTGSSGHTCKSNAIRDFFPLLFGNRGSQCALQISSDALTLDLLGRISLSLMTREVKDDVNGIKWSLCAESLLEFAIFLESS